MSKYLQLGTLYTNISTTIYSVYIYIYVSAIYIYKIKNYREPKLTLLRFGWTQCAELSRWAIVGMVRCGVVWCGGVWCGVVWCGVV